MILNRRGEYSILGMIYLAGATDGDFIEINEVARAVGVPEKFLRILFHELVKSGLLRSQRGTGGGFALGRPSAQITLRQIVEAIQGPITAFDCVTGQSADCAKAPGCGLHALLENIRTDIVRKLESCTLSDLATIEAQGLTTLHTSMPPTHTTVVSPAHEGD